jgi:hypothetical protein
MSSFEVVPGNTEETMSQEKIDEKSSWLNDIVARCPKSVVYGIAASSALIVLGWAARVAFRSRK